MKEDPAILNERSLKQIIRTIRLSEGDFSLILANCNYIGLRKKLLEQLKTLSSFDIREIYLPDSVLTIFSFARDILEDELPDAAMVLGLESVKAIDSVLVATNQVREEFRNNFLFPVILWVNDDLLNKFLRIAPDFRSWAGSPFRFEPLHNDLTEALQGTANKLSDGFLKYDESLTVSELESFLKSFLEDAENLVLDYDQELKADLLFLQGKKAQNDNQADSALAFYRESLGCLGQSRKQTQQGVLLYYIAGCCEQNNDLENARLHFRESAKKLSCQKELSARITRDLCRILRKLEDWNELEKVAEKSLENDYFILARTRQKKDEPGTAIENLKSASESGVSESDPELFIEILELLHVLYFEQGEYLEAFRIKQEKYSTEQQFGFRAFIGAGRLKALRYRRIREADITREIWESGRQIDLDRLITRISRTDCKLIVLHGQSGVGKSSILEAGLEPALKQKRIVTRDVLPILVRSYTGWVKNTCLLLGQRSEIPGDWKVADILDELRKNEDQNILTVLIFDQFEEFFFANSEPAERREFYSFLHDSLNIPFVKVILSLREDYLHYLLECERIANLDMLNNDILNKNIRYYVGNFTPEDAKSVIINLTERAQFYLEESLIDRLVQDLAEETGEVRPIEMQVVGSQLQAENITSLEKYKSKQELVAGFLKEVISDCGKENEDVSLMILYLLTDENNTRPLKTRPELANELKNSDFEVKNEQMDLILDILVGSGLVFFVPEKPADRFQIVHDYLVKFIRAEHLLRMEERQKLKSKESIVKELNASSHALLLSNDGLRALLEGIKAGKISKQTNIPTMLKNQTIYNLREIVYSIYEKNRLEGHESPVHCVDFSPDGKTLASGGEDYTVKLWNVDDGRKMITLKGHSSPVFSVKFSPNSEILASGSHDGTIKLWNIEDFYEIYTLKGHSDYVRCVDFSPDGKILASGSRDSTIRLWNVENGCEIKTLKGHSDYVNSVNFSPDGKTLASGSGDNNIILWDLENNSQLFILRGHSYYIHSTSFSPDGKILASGSYDSTIKLWDAVNGIEIKTLKGHSNYVFSVSFSPDGKTLVSGSSDSTIRLWDIENGTQTNIFKGHSSNVRSVNFSPNGKIYASGSHDGTIRLWNLENIVQINTLKAHSKFVRSVKFSPDGKILASGSDDNTIKLWDIISGIEINVLKGHSKFVRSVNFSPDGKMLASGSDDNTIILWKIEDGTQLKRFKAHSAYVSSVNFSPDGKILASGSYDRTIKLWNIEDGSEIKILKGEYSRVNSLDFSPDGKILASGCLDRTIKLWDVEDGSEIKILKGGYGGVNSLNFSPNGKILASGSYDNTIKLLSMKNYKEINVLKGHSSYVTSVVFSPDGKILASGSRDNTIKLWNVEDGSEINTLRGHSNYIESLCFSPDGKILSSGSADSTIKLWNVNILCKSNIDDLLLHGCKWLHGYLKNNPNVPKEDRCLCDDILSEPQINTDGTDYTDWEHSKK